MRPASAPVTTVRPNIQTLFTKYTILCNHSRCWCPAGDIHYSNMWHNCEAPVTAQIWTMQQHLWRLVSRQLSRCFLNNASTWNSSFGLAFLFPSFVEESCVSFDFSQACILSRPPAGAGSWFGRAAELRRKRRGGLLPHLPGIRTLLQPGEELHDAWTSDFSSCKGNRFSVRYIFECFQCTEEMFLLIFRLTASLALAAILISCWTKDGCSNARSLYHCC